MVPEADLLLKGRVWERLLLSAFLPSFLPFCVGSSLLCVRAFPNRGKQGLLFVVVRGLLIAVASLVAEQKL